MPLHRLLQAYGLSGRPRREATERRAFRHALAGDLWMGDVMHGPLVIAPNQRRRKSYLHLFIDSADLAIRLLHCRPFERSDGLHSNGWKGRQSA